MQLQNSQSKLPNETILLPSCTHSIGCQCLLKYNTIYSPSVIVHCQILVQNTCPKSCKLRYHQDSSVRPVTTVFVVYPLSKQKPLVKDPFHMQAIWSGVNFHMTSEIYSQKPHSERPSKSISLPCTAESQNVLSRLPQMSHPGFCMLFCCCCCFYAPFYH